MKDFLVYSVTTTAVENRGHKPWQENNDNNNSNKQSTLNLSHKEARSNKLAERRRFFSGSFVSFGALLRSIRLDEGHMSERRFRSSAQKRYNESSGYL